MKKVIEYTCQFIDNAENIDTMPNADEFVKEVLAEQFLEVVERHMEVKELTNEEDRKKGNRRFGALLSLNDISK